MEKEFDRTPGDSVWVMHNNKAVCGIIKRVFFCHGIDCVNFSDIITNEEYEVYADEKSIGMFKLKEMFSSKAELINSL